MRAAVNILWVAFFLNLVGLSTNKAASIFNSILLYQYTVHLVYQI